MEEVLDSYYLIVQNGMVVASVISPPEMGGTSLRESFHYARQYSLEGPVMIAKVVYETPQE